MTRSPALDALPLSFERAPERSSNPPSTQAAPACKSGRDNQSAIGTYATPVLCRTSKVLRARWPGCGFGILTNAQGLALSLEGCGIADVRAQRQAGYLHQLRPQG